MSSSTLRPDDKSVQPAVLPAVSAQPSPRLWSIAITPHTLWVAVGIVVLAASVWAVIAAGIQVLTLLFTAIIIAEGLRPIMNVLHTRCHLPKPAAVLLINLVILLAVGIVGWLLVDTLAGQVGALWATLPLLGARGEQLLQQLDAALGNSPQITAAVQSAGNQAGAFVQGALAFVVTVPQMIGGFIFGVVVVTMMVFFWLTGISGLRTFVLGLLPATSQPLANDVLADLSRRLGGYLRGVVVNMCVIGVLSALGDWLLGAPFPLVLGLVAALTQVVPYFGPWISSLLAILVVLPLAGPLKAAEVIGFYIVLQTIVGNTLTPIIMSDAVDINPLLAIVAVLLGSEMFGVAGAVLGVPAVAVVQVFVVRVLAPIARRAAAGADRAAPVQPSATKYTETAD